MPSEKNHPADEPLLPEMVETDADGLGAEADGVDPDDLELIEDLAGAEEDGEELPEEDDDNPYQESDEALPDDDEEKAIDHLLRQDGGGRFGEG